MADKTTKEQMSEWLRNMPKCAQLEELPTVEKLHLSHHETGHEFPEVYDNGYRISLIIRTSTWSEKDE